MQTVMWSFYFLHVITLLRADELMMLDEIESELDTVGERWTPKCNGAK